MSKEEIKKKIETLEKGIKSGSVPAGLVSKMKAQVDSLIEQLKEAEKEPEQKPAPKKKEKEDNTIKINGKVISKDEQDWCAKVMKEVEKARDKRRASQKKSDNKPDNAKAKDQVADAVANVIDATPDAKAKSTPAKAGEDIVTKLLSFIEKALKTNKAIAPSKKKMVHEALAIIKDLLKDFK